MAREGVVRPVQVPARPRINVVGTTGSGKTTMARNLAARLSVAHIELGQNSTDDKLSATTRLISSGIERL